MMRVVKPRKTVTRRPITLNSVRIIGGAWRGRRVHFPDSPGLRPTPDRVRETLFNWLQRPIAGARCLDLFAGSGALGLEALSRGAREVWFVEPAFAAAQMLAEELKRLHGGAPGAPGGRILQMSAERFLATPGVPEARGVPLARGVSATREVPAARGVPAAPGVPEARGVPATLAVPGVPASPSSATSPAVPPREPFDVIFLDPPFGLDALPEYVRLIDAGGWVANGGWVYLESPRSAGQPAIPSHWELVKSKSAGEVGYHLARAYAEITHE